MTKRTRKNKFSAFSLVELMAAVTVVSILVTLALPRFRAFIARSRMAEAKTNLGILATLAQSYEAEYGVSSVPAIFVGASGDDSCTTNSCAVGTENVGQRNELGFRVVNCGELRYCYHGATNFYADSGKEIYPGCSPVQGQDSWDINENRQLQHSGTANAIKKCSN